MSRRPSVSIYDYPEDLNPFNDDSTPSTARHINGETKNAVKEPKHKFWTFGRNKKKQRSNSFSIKSTWSGLFGKRKDSQEVEIRKPTIATVSSTYKRGTYNGYPVAPARLSTDQQEFDEALGTLTRRRKYTFDNSSRYGSSLTVNGDPGRIYEGSPQDTTASIMGDLTPKPPARRFGQMSPKTTDKIPPLDFNGKESTSNGNVVLDERGSDQTPIPPKRGGPRASQRSIVPASFNGEDVTLTDENENVPEDYVFKRFSHDAIRKSNLSINSCISVGSTVSAYGRKKRRAPQPPRLKEPLESPKEISVNSSEAEQRNGELQIVESIDIARVTENIDEMTKRNREMDDNFIPASAIRNENEKEEKSQKEEKGEKGEKGEKEEKREKREKSEKEEKEGKEETNVANESISSSSEVTDMPVTREERKISKPRRSSKEEPREGNDVKTRKISSEERLIAAPEKSTEDDVSSSKKNCEVEAEVEVELRRDSGAEKIEIIKEIGVSSDTEEHTLTRRTSSGNLSRSDSFSVKDEIEKIERQIKLLEERKQRDDSEAEVNEINDRSDARISLQETRKNFFRNMVDEDRVKVELRELPREQKEIKVIRLEDPPVAVDGPREPVKVIELHISEPIKRRPSIVGDREVNPIPKPRRHSNLGLESKESRPRDRGEKDTDDKRGNSL